MTGSGRSHLLSCARVFSEGYPVSVTMTAPPPPSNAVTAMPIRAYYYQQFDADSSLDVPAEAYGGWKEADLTFAREHTALVVMHAWDCGTRQQYPGWHRCVEYIPRAER